MWLSHPPFVEQMELAGLCRCFRRLPSGGVPLQGSPKVVGIAGRKRLFAHFGDNFFEVTQCAYRLGWLAIQPGFVLPARSQQHGILNNAQRNSSFIELFGDGNVAGTEAHLDVAQAKTALPNRVDVLLQFCVDGRLSVHDSAIRPELVTNLKLGAPMLVPRRGDLTDCGSFQFRYIAADSAFGL